MISPRISNRENQLNVITQLGATDWWDGYKLPAPASGRQAGRQQHQRDLES